MVSFIGGGRFRELLRKYGKVAIGVHFSVSAISITGLYIAIRNNVDVESLLEKLHVPGASHREQNQRTPPDASPTSDGTGTEQRPSALNETGGSAGEPEKKKNRTAELASSTGGALALAMLFNKVLLPIRIPITVALTPPIAKLLKKRGILKNGV